jgi:hypothetical protein
MNTKTHRISATSQPPRLHSPNFINERGGRWHISASWIVPLLLLTFPALVEAQFNYTTNGGRIATITITGYTGPGGDVAIPDTIYGLPVTTIGAYAFHSCTNLTSVVVGNDVTNIESNAFQACTKLTSVTIPDSVITIGQDVFYLCVSLTSVTLGSNVSFIDYSAFFECHGLTRITVDAFNPHFSSVDGGLFSKSQTILITCPGGKTGSYIVPNGVTSIGDFAFFSCTNLTSVTVPKSVQSIDNSAFASCTGLKSVFFQGDRPFVDSSAFYADNPTVYYLPGTTGWETKLFGLLTVLWNPQVQTMDASFGVRSNQFGFTITGTMDIPLVVEACSDLTVPTWIPLQNCTLTNGLLYFNDPQWTNYPTRLYRIHSP